MIAQATTAPAAAQTAQTPSSAPPPIILTKYEIPADQAKYIVTSPEMEQLLTKKFGAGLNFNVSTKNGRWIYYAQRQLTTKEINEWIAQVHKRRKAEAKAEAEAETGADTEAKGQR